MLQKYSNLLLLDLAAAQARWTLRQSQDPEPVRLSRKVFDASKSGLKLHIQIESASAAASEATISHRRSVKYHKDWFFEANHQPETKKKKNSKCCLADVVTVVVVVVVNTN